MHESNWDTWPIKASDSSAIVLSVLQADGDSVTSLKSSRTPNNNNKSQKHTKKDCLKPKSSTRKKKKTIIL